MPQAHCWGGNADRDSVRDGIPDHAFRGRCHREGRLSHRDDGDPSASEGNAGTAGGQGASAPAQVVTDEKRGIGGFQAGGEDGGGGPAESRVVPAARARGQ
jgi:hypothetical protein